jgi:anti-sigma factor RsiW
MAETDCISDQALKAFVLGELPERLAGAIARHLELCADCDARARRCDDLADSAIQALRGVAVPGPDARRKLPATAADRAAVTDQPGTPRLLRPPPRRGTLAASKTVLYDPATRGRGQVWPLMLHEVQYNPEARARIAARVLVAAAVDARREALAGAELSSKGDEARAAFQQIGGTPEGRALLLKRTDLIFNPPQSADVSAEGYLAMRNGNCLTFHRVER